MEARAHVRLGAEVVDAASSAFFRIDSVGGSPKRILSGRVVFNTAENVPWFADPNPSRNAAFSTVTPLGGEFEVPNAPGGVAWLNTGIEYTEPTTPDAEDRWDLLTIAMHEIGHGLGLVYDVPLWADHGQEFPISDDVSRFYAGYGVFLHSGLEHIDGPGVIPFFPPQSIRAFPAARDIMAMAELSHYRRPVLDPYFEMIIGDLDIPRGVKTSLVAKLRNAARLARAGHSNAARNQLEAFTRHVAANPGKRLSPEQIEGLTGMIQARIAEL